MNFKDLLLRLVNIEREVDSKVSEEQVNEALEQMIYYDVVSKNKTKSKKDDSNNK